MRATPANWSDVRGVGGGSVASVHEEPADQGHLRRRGPRALQPGVHRGGGRGGGRGRRGLWLTGEAAWFALPGRAASFSLPLATPLADLLDTVLAGGQVTVCSQCAERRGIDSGAVLPGVRDRRRRDVHRGDPDGRHPGPRLLTCRTRPPTRRIHRRPVASSRSTRRIFALVVGVAAYVGRDLRAQPEQDVSRTQRGSDGHDAEDDPVVEDDDEQRTQCQGYRARQ